jgi:S-adenosylmethionine decarboxylase
LEKFKGSEVGTHVIADIVGIKDPFKLDSIDKMQAIFHAAAKKAKMNVIAENWKKFEPQGLSGVLFLSESHLSIHYSPEHGFAWVDSFTCGNEGSAKIAVEYICKKMRPDMSRTKIEYKDRTIKY